MQKKAHLERIQILNMKTLRNYGKRIFLDDVLKILLNICKQILFRSKADCAWNMVCNCDKFERRIESNVALLRDIPLDCLAILPFQKFVIELCHFFFNLIFKYRGSIGTRLFSLIILFCLFVLVWRRIYTFRGLLLWVPVRKIKFAPIKIALLLARGYFIPKSSPK